MQWTRWLGHFVGAHHSESGTASAPQTRGIVIVSGWRYDIMMWIGNVASHGEWQALRQSTADLARLQPGEAALDVGCGTGTLALLAKQRVGNTGRVCGIDPSPGMIARARRKAARNAWRLTFRPV